MSDSSSSSSTSTSSGGIGPPRGTSVFSADAENIVEAIERPRRPPEPETDSDHLTLMRKYRIEDLDLPSFGEPDPDCGDYVPGSLYFCPRCAATHEKRHICYRYDCPQHWPYAVRRRAAGSKSGSGVAPQLDALRRYLNSYRNENQYYHHVVISPPDDDLLFQVDDPMKRLVDVAREVMDHLGIQGLVAYHPRRGENEAPGEDDRGKWKDRIGEHTTKEALEEETRFSPHLHIVGVAPYVDIGVTEEVERRTGWLIHRIANEKTGISIEDDEAMARAVTYSLSHAGIYDTENGERYLAAWMKGPDVDRVTPTAKNAERMKAIVNSVGEDTLGIAAPVLDCDREAPPELDLGPEDVLDVEPFERASAQRDPWSPEPFSGFSGPRVATRSSGAPDPGAPPVDRGNAAYDPDRDDTWRMGRSTSTTSSRSRASTTSSSSSSGAGSSDVDDELQECGAHLRHISVAGEYLLDGEWRRAVGDRADELEEAYRGYVRYMENKNLDPLDDRPTIPDEDPPP